MIREMISEMISEMNSEIRIAMSCADLLHIAM